VPVIFTLGVSIMACSRNAQKPLQNINFLVALFRGLLG
jgi:hypothetical protein